MIPIFKEITYPSAKHKVILKVPWGSLKGPYCLKYKYIIFFYYYYFSLNENEYYSIAVREKKNKDLNILPNQPGHDKTNQYQA